MYRDRHCARGDHWREISQFRVLANGFHARDCIACETDRANLTARQEQYRKVNAVMIKDETRDRLVSAVDIDRIYVTRGMMTRKQLEKLRA